MTTRSSRSRAPRSSALPRALLSTASSSRAAGSDRSAAVSTASSARRPRIRSANGRIFRGDMSAYRCFALYSIGLSITLAAGVRSRRRGRGFLLAAAVALEGPRRRELAELVADHVLGHEHLMNCLPLWTRNVGRRIGHDRAVARPGLDRLAVACACAVSTLASSRSSTYGPFFSERLIGSRNPLHAQLRARSAGPAGGGG